MHYHSRLTITYFEDFGDYDGDGKTDAAIDRGGTWYVLKTIGGLSIPQFGLANDKPVPAVFAN